MREEVGKVAGFSANFSPPIQLRFDELVSGVKSAIGIKIFGDDLVVLKDRADDVARMLGKVAGAADINVEKVSGFAYLQVEVNRERKSRPAPHPLSNPSLTTELNGI